MYYVLMKVNIRYGKDVDGFLEKMKVDNVEVDGETEKIFNII